MRVLIIHDHISDAASPDQADALTQARAIAAALETLGHEWMTLGVTLDLHAAREAIARLQPDVVFNLVESLAGNGRLIHVLPALLDVMGVPYTGATSEMQFITSHKPLAKQLMRTASIATPAFLTIEHLRECVRRGLPRCEPATRWILKSMWEHASVGLDASSVIETDDPLIILRELESRLDRLGGTGFAEQYIDGREFNIGLLASGDGAEPKVLPAAEIAFRQSEAGADGWEGRPRIVNYDCKWNENSFEYHHTERVFEFTDADQPLLQRMVDISRACWTLFELRGYARVDFRVDAAGEPWVLEVNTNPCLSPDAGYAYALERGNLPYARAIERILEDSIRSQNVCSELK